MAKHWRQPVRRPLRRKAAPMPYITALTFKQITSYILVGPVEG